MATELATIHSLYDRDLSAWLEETIGQLRRQDYGAVDWANVIDELEYMSRRERQALENNLVILLLHLLKWQYQPEMRSGSGNGSIVEHRRRLRKALQASPSLQPYLLEILAEAYADAIAQASAETGLARDAFPLECEYAIASILNPGFLPD
jgi:hypothetical protein